MGKIRTTYSIETKLKAINLYFKKDMGIKTIAEESGIGSTTIHRWIKHFNNEGIQGLEEKRGSSPSPLKGRPKKLYESESEKINRLEAENVYLKKLLAAKRRMIQEKKNQ